MDQNNCQHQQKIGNNKDNNKVKTTLLQQKVLRGTREIQKLRLY